MPLMRFNILNTDEATQVDGIDYPLLINTDHVVTIKPIKIMHQGNLINCYWVRTDNGKKYKATRIPKSLQEILKDSDSLTETVINSEVDRVDPEEIVRGH